MIWSGPTPAADTHPESLSKRQTRRRVKMRRFGKALLLGAFLRFRAHFLRVKITALSTVSTR